MFSVYLAVKIKVFDIPVISTKLIYLEDEEGLVESKYSRYTKCLKSGVI